MRQTLLDSLMETLALVKSGKLDAAPEFIQTPIGDLLEICNACGAAGSKLPVPQTAYGMNIKPMCHIHDFDYNRGATIQDKDCGDRRMRNNGFRLIRLRSHWSLRGLRSGRIQTYYIMVNIFGGPAFWDGKL